MQVGRILETALYVSDIGCDLGFMSADRRPGLPFPRCSAENRSGHALLQQGRLTCCRPSLLTSFNDVLAPPARIWTCVGFDSSPKLIADPSSVAAILTFGAPSESISLKSTVSG